MPLIIVYVGIGIFDAATLDKIPYLSHPVGDCQHFVEFQYAVPLCLLGAYVIIARILEFRVGIYNLTARDARYLFPEVADLIVHGRKIVSTFFLGSERMYDRFRHIADMNEGAPLGPAKYRERAVAHGTRCHIVHR